MSTTKKNGRIEFLRFVFALGILFFHIHKRFIEEGEFLELGNSGLNFFARGYIGVEFFFLVSGYLLAASAFSKMGDNSKAIGTETALMMKKKFWNIFPYHFFAIVITIIVNAYYLEHTALGRAGYAIDSWASMFFLQVFGFDSTWVNKLTWYLDVWFMVTFMFYYFLRKHYDTFVKIFCPMLALFILGYMAHEYDGIAGIDGWTGMFYKCFLRGLAEMALGCTTYSMTRQINKYKFTKAGKRLLGFVELICYIIVLIYACTEMDVKYSFPVIFVMWVAIILTFSNINPCARVFNHPIFLKLGTASLLIYLNQFYAIRLVQEHLDSQSFVVKVLACVAITFIGAFICNQFVNLLRRHNPMELIIVKQPEGE